MLSSLLLKQQLGTKATRASLINAAGRRLAKTIILIQIIVIALACAVSLIGIGKNAAIAAFAGGISALVPYAIFAKLAFSLTGARMAQNTVRAFYLGESVKIFSSVIFLVVGLAIFRFNAELILIGYVIAMVPVWLGPLFLKSR
ncbi:ATP synthase subunit I [Echinimonas agarilytica]|uniref:ATP synthase subunit I n=1 Tax=Echinimonas agarilytica TaxID=1215918 RepID=A0AA41W3I1_9GAMM|nr:ATP synthase subunit I [Echinimonas agarilytica]MCM2678117.1 ATP synthase subunit I [Echinimonas agarilytica]